MKTLRMAVQKDGRLSEKSIEILRKCGIQLPNGSRTLKSTASNFPLELLYLRDDDIPQYVEQGIADIGILGENEVWEKKRDVQTIRKLGFAACRMSLAIPREIDYPGINYFEGKTVATSYPLVLQKFFKQQALNVSVEQIGGSVEIAPSIGLAGGIFDIVSSGSTLQLNGLKEVAVVAKSEAVMIRAQALADEKQAILNKLLFRLDAVRKAEAFKYILLNAPNAKVDELIALLPGMQSPSILPLARVGWSSVHAVVPEDDFWELTEKLKGLGAEGILVSPIEKLIL